MTILFWNAKDTPIVKARAIFQIYNYTFKTKINETQTFNLLIHMIEAIYGYTEKFKKYGKYFEQ